MWFFFSPWFELRGRRNTKVIVSWTWLVARHVHTGGIKLNSSEIKLAIRWVAKEENCPINESLLFSHELNLTNYVANNSFAQLLPLFRNQRAHWNQSRTFDFCTSHQRVTKFPIVKDNDLSQIQIGPRLDQFTWHNHLPIPLLGDDISFRDPVKVSSIEWVKERTAHSSLVNVIHLW